jgi:hypothetical protein
MQQRCLWAIAVTGLAVGACSGRIGDAAGGARPGDPPADPTPPGARVANIGSLVAQCRDPAAHRVGRAPLQRLTARQYQNVVRDLVGMEAGIDEFTADESVGTFAGNTQAAVAPVQVDAYRAAAERVGAAVAAAPNLVVSCDPAAGDSCAAAFIRDFGLRAFRRPLRPDEESAYLAIHQLGAARGGFGAGVGLVVRTLLQSPNFLYLVEPAPAATAPAPLGAYQMATRLSFLLWESMPDAALLTAAAGNALSTPQQLRQQATRMLADPKAHDALASFAAQWLVTTGTTTLEKSPALFPSFDDATRQAMAREVGNFIDFVVRAGDAGFATLLTAPFSVIDGPLFALYGVPAPADAGKPVRVDFPAGQRSGLLTQAAFLASHAHADQGSPIKRGVMVRQAVLCQDLPPPPANVNNAPPTVTPNSTTRERFAQHVANPTCASCHTLIDPIGFGFERFDAIGRYRETENGQTIDDSGSLTATSSPEVQGPFNGPAALASKLAATDEARSCFVTQWFRYGLKREPAAEDACTAKALVDAFRASNYNVRELLLALATSDGFRYGGSAP